MVKNLCFFARILFSVLGCFILKFCFQYIVITINLNILNIILAKKIYFKWNQQFRCAANIFENLHRSFKSSAWFTMSTLPSSARPSGASRRSTAARICAARPSSASRYKSSAKANTVIFSQKFFNILLVLLLHFKTPFHSIWLSFWCVIWLLTF